MNTITREQHRLNELTRAENLIREIIFGDGRFLSGCSMTNLAEIGGILAVEKEQLRRDTRADHATVDHRDMAAGASTP